MPVTAPAPPRPIHAIAEGLTLAAASAPEAAVATKAIKSLREQEDLLLPPGGCEERGAELVFQLCSSLHDRVGLLRRVRVDDQVAVSRLEHTEARFVGSGCASDGSPCIDDRFGLDRASGQGGQRHQRGRFSFHGVEGS